MLQHVLRPSQHRRETNPAVYRPLVPSSATAKTLSCCPITYALMMNIYDIAKKKRRDKLGMTGLAEEGTGVKRDGHALNLKSPVFYILVMG